MPHYSSLLLFVDDFVGDRLTFGVGAFVGERHGLAVLGNHRSTSGMVFPTSFLRLSGKRVGIDLLDCDGVPRRICDGIFFAVVFGSIAGIDSCPVFSLPCTVHLYPTVRCFPHHFHA